MNDPALSMVLDARLPCGAGRFVLAPGFGGLLGAEHTNIPHRENRR